ncbi:MAG: hypothetical protein WAO08_35880, partial [Hyphomicrobiaceae bacterium]
ERGITILHCSADESAGLRRLVQWLNGKSIGGRDDFRPDYRIDLNKTPIYGVGGIDLGQGKGQWQRNWRTLSR